MKKLEQRLGLGSVITISMGSMLGSGIFVLPGVAFGLTGSSLGIAYMFAAICILPAAMSKSELASAMPTSGGTYVYLERTFGPLAGTVAGLGLYLSLLLKSAFALVGFAAYLEVLTTVPLQLTATSLLIFIVAVNILGVGKVSGFLSLIVMISVVSLMALVGVASFEVPWAEFRPEFTNGPMGVLSTTALVFVAFAGVTNVAAIAEEIKDPEKNIPRAIMISLLLVTAMYIGVTTVMAGALPMDQLVGNLKPVYTLTNFVAGPTFALVAAIISILTMVSMANAGILASSRFPFAMARDNLLPSFFGTLNERFLTPIWSILASGLIVAIVIWFLDIEKIVKFASVFMIMIYMLENVAVILLRETRVQWYKPTYRSFAYPGLQIFGIATSLLLLTAMGQIVPIALLSVGIPGVFLYLLFSRKRTDRRGVLGIRLPRKDLLEEEPPQRHIERLQFSQTTRVVVAMFGNERSPEVLAEMGMALAHGDHLEVVHFTEIPEQTDLDDIISDNVQVRAIRRRVNHMSQRLEAPLTFDPIVSHDIYKSVNDISQRLDCKWLVVEWGGKTRWAITFHNPMGWLREHLSCHLMTFRDKGVRYFKKIMLIVKTDKSNELLLETANHLATVNSAEITITSFVESDQEQEVLDLKKHVLESMVGKCPSAVASLLLEGPSEWEAYVRATDEFDLVIFESGQVDTIYKRLFGTPFDRMIEHSACSVVSIKTSRKAGGIGYKILEGARAIIDKSPKF